MLTIIAGIIALVLYFRLSERIDHLEELLKGRQGSTPNAAPAFSAETRFIPPAPASTLSTHFENTGSTSTDKFIEWLKDDWPLKSGIILLLIGFGWFTTYAFMHNWIGPMGRITLGIIAGAGFLLLGNWRIKSYLHQGGAFLVLGSTTILLTLFAAREVYGFFTPISALLVMFLSTAWVALVSVKYNNKALSLASLVLAGIAPLLTHIQTYDYVSLFSYLIVVVIGAIWISFVTGQRELTTASLLLVFFYSLPHLMGMTGADRGVLLLFIYAFASIFFLTNISALLKAGKRDSAPDVMTAACNGLLLLVWIFVGAQAEWKSLIISAWTVVFLAGSYLIYAWSGNKNAFYTYAGLAVAMIAAATSVELDGASLVIAYTIESAMVILMIRSVLKDYKLAATSVWLLAGPIFLSFQSFISNSWQISTFNRDSFVLFLLGIVCFGLGLLFSRQNKEFKEEGDLQIGSRLIQIGSVYAYALVWKVLHSSIADQDMAVMISLVIYTIVAICTYFYGKSEGKRVYQVYGGALLGLVIARLFLVDVWNMELTGKIITFFLLGTLLVSTAFIGKKKPSMESQNNLQA